MSMNDNDDKNSYLNSEKLIQPVSTVIEKETRQNEQHVHVILSWQWKNMAYVAPVPFMVINTMTTYGLDLASTTTLATEIFIDDFETCKDISNDDIDNLLKIFSILPVAQGQILLMQESK